MTKTERHEIAVVVKQFIEDECDEIRRNYEFMHGTLKGLRKYIRQECIEFWTNHEPYLEHEVLGLEWMKIGKHIINLDDCWCFIRDGLKLEMPKV